MVLLGVALDTSLSLGRTVTGRILRPMVCVDQDQIELATIGREMDHNAWAQSKKRALALHAETTRIADALERTGYPAYRPDRQLGRVCGVTLAEEAVTRAFRHIKILPSVQVADTVAYRRELLAFITGHQVKAQMVVFGQDWCRPEDLRQRICWLSRRISKIAANLRRVWSADLFFRNIEMTYHRDDTGQLMVHVHSHGFLDHPWYAPEKYKEFKDHLRSISPKSVNGKGHVNLTYITPDRLQEVVKYPFQPEKGEDRFLTDEEWRVVAEQTERLKFFAPLGGFKKWRADLRPVDEPERRLVVVDGTDGPLLYAKAGVKAGKREPSTGTSKDVIVNVLRPSPRFAPRATPAILIADRSAEPIGDVLRREGYGQLIDGWRAVYNARVQQCDRMPLFEPRSPTEAARRGWRIEVHGGIAFAVSEAAERFEASSAKARSARAAKVMQHTTTATVPQGVTGLRSKALRMPIHVSPALP